tara:strand:- start:5673 stop:5918 length:246 start_codon:yes stop_codon:yes gene_type:complete
MAGKSYKALVGLTYPDAVSFKLIPKGGLSKMKPEQLSKVKYKNAAAGKIVDDLPEGAVKWLLKDGLITEVSQTVKKKVTRK